MDPTAGALDAIMERVREEPRRVVFAEGEEQKVVRAAVAYRDAGYGRPVLIGREDRVMATLASLGLGKIEGIEIHNARLSGANPKYTDFLYDRLQRKGFLRRDCQRLVNQDRNVFAACMVATGDADAMVTGLTRSTADCLEYVGRAIGPAPGRIAFGLTVMLGPHGRTIFVADSQVHFRPNAEELVDIVIGAAATVTRLMGHEPRVALLSHSTFGDPPHEAGDPDARRREAPRRAQSRFRIRWRNEPGRRVGAVHPRLISVLPADGGCQCADHAGFAFVAHKRAADASSRWRNDDRPAADRHGKAGADRADGCHGQPDRRCRLHRCVSVRGGTMSAREDFAGALALGLLLSGPASAQAVLQSKLLSADAANC